MTWTYAAFGLMHGIFMVVSVLTLKRRNAFFKKRPLLTRVRVVTAPLITFHLVVLALIVFRADSLEHALVHATHLIPVARAGIPPMRLDFTLVRLKPTLLGEVLVGAAIMELVHWGMRQPSWSQRFLAAPKPLRWGLYYAIILLIPALGNSDKQNFIYAQF
jgi:hypothetical protein